MIRVGRKKGNKNPSVEGYINVVVHTKSSPYGEIGPYCLKDESGRIMENIWQFSKVYRQVPRSLQRYSRWQPFVIWDHPAETHHSQGKLTEQYFKWREKGMKNGHPVRYPVGWNKTHRASCIGSITDEELFSESPKLLSYIEARKEIYLRWYVKLVKDQPKFKKLQALLKKGKKLLIIEVDGPHQESLQYYKKKYGVPDDFIENDTMIAAKENLTIMLKDEKHPFGHGYCLAAALRGFNL